ncbi:MAG: hypothetical protein RJA22_2760 [Verrucomicrobiota bacterium]
MSDRPDPGSAGAPAHSLFQGYMAGPEAFDEAREPAPGGFAARPHWQRFAAALERLGPRELAGRWENGRRILREHGVTYNVYGDPQGTDRPWGLDLVPLLIPPGDWAAIEAGLIQRTRLFNRILADLYGGGQRLLRDGFLPPELVYANPAFLRPCRGLPVPRHVYLHLHACDLARAADGRWWVLSDRTQAPSGAGYALENRTVTSRILPDELLENNVRRLGPFFRAQREMLLRLAPRHRPNPALVLLTPGPLNETYFEHAFLARHLGIPLVEGADLTVRDRRVFLKTLEGLKPVDVILRRVDDSFCDPLELRADSMLGVPGLVEAARAGQVTVANALGSGLMETPALLAFLPGVCQHLLGEELRLPSVATWWCGQAAALRQVLDRLDELVVKPAFGAPGKQSWFGGRLTPRERDDLIARIRARPADFVGQERVVLSRAPVWADPGLEARSVVVRVYAANDGDQVRVLPGGLTRVSRTSEDPVVTMQHGGGSKDTWVIESPAAAPGPSPEGPQARPAAGTEPAAETGAEPETAGPRGRVDAGVPSRAADNLFWLGRYTERLEQTLRALRCVLGRLSDEGARDDSTTLAALGDLMAGLELAPARREFSARELQQQLLQRVYKPQLTGSVRELVGRVRFIASTVRDRFSGDTWRILGRLDADAGVRPGRLPLADALALIHNLVLDLAAFNGMEMENMTRGHGWRFLDLGRRVERGQRVVELLRATAGVPRHRALLLEPVLEIADCLMTYRRLHLGEPRLPEVLELLLRDPANPRSLAFQVRVLEQHLAGLPQPPGADGTHDGRRLLALARALEAATGGHGPGHAEAGLAAWLDGLAGELAAFSDEITHRYFTHVAPRLS